VLIKEGPGYCKQPHSGSEERCAALCVLCPQGEPSVFQREAQGLRERCGKKKNNYQIAGRDYDHQDFCQASRHPPLLLFCCTRSRSQYMPAGLAWRAGVL
jgi:hypothetical protein